MTVRERILWDALMDVKEMCEKIPDVDKGINKFIEREATYRRRKY